MKFWPLIGRNIVRQRWRTSLTMLGIAASVFIFAALLSLDQGVDRMVERTGKESVITVFERYKACPPYSSLPVHYAEQISRVAHVREVMAVRFLLSNCQTTTDLVAVHGVDKDRLRAFETIDLPEAHYKAFQSERSAALVGQAMATRYGWKIGEQVTLKELRSVSFVIRGIFSAPGSNLESLILVDREFLGYSIDQVGVATMFRVLVDDPKHVDTTSKAIDALFANAPKQTSSGPEKAFIAMIIDDFSALVRFTRLVAYLALVLLLAAMANSVSMSVRDRMREIAVLKTLGFRRARIVRLLAAEAVLVATLAAAIGCAAATAVLGLGAFSISIEGYTIIPSITAGIWATSLAAGALLGLFGALIPAIGAAGHTIVSGMRKVDA
ncbi:MAG: ABC transporter permease [Bradymonadaceae bacterium]|nr:ABC transporter permease [Lujinxingiaceae bacterium]